MIPLSNVVFDSPILASLLSMCISTGRDFDGLLFGQSRVLREVNIKDDGQRETTREELYVTGFSCNSDLGTFYSADGSIDHERFQETVGPSRRMEDVVGMVVSRAFSQKRLAPQDQAVVDCALTLTNRPYMVVGYFAPSTEHDRSCIATGYTFFECRLGSSPRPLPVRIRNLGTTLGMEHYQDVEFMRPGGFEHQVVESHKLAEGMQSELHALFNRMSQLASAARDAELAMQDAEYQWHRALASGQPGPAAQGLADGAATRQASGGAAAAVPPAAAPPVPQVATAVLVDVGPPADPVQAQAPQQAQAAQPQPQQAAGEANLLGI